MASDPDIAVRAVGVGFYVAVAGASIALVSVAMTWFELSLADFGAREGPNAIEGSSDIYMSALESGVGAWLGILIVVASVAAVVLGSVTKLKVAESPLFWQATVVGVLIGGALVGFALANPPTATYGVVATSTYELSLATGAWVGTAAVAVAFFGVTIVARANNATIALIARQDRRIFDRGRAGSMRFSYKSLAAVGLLMTFVGFLGGIALFVIGYFLVFETFDDPPTGSYFLWQDIASILGFVVAVFIAVGLLLLLAAALKFGVSIFRSRVRRQQL